MTSAAYKYFISSLFNFQKAWFSTFYYRFFTRFEIMSWMPPHLGSA